MSTNINIEGTWEIESAFMTVDGKTDSTLDSSRKMIKIFTPTHFAFFSKSSNRKRFESPEPDHSAIAEAFATLDAGGGTYTIENDTYTENVEYCTYPNYEGESLQFSISLKEGKLVQEGVYPLVKLGFGDKDGYVVETYRKISAD